MKIIRVGDPHAKVSNLEEMKALILFVIETAIKHNISRIELLGDLFHTHAVLRLEVVQFWTWAFEALDEVCETVVLVGNHDLSGDYHSNNSALSVFSLMGWKGLTIVEEPKLIGAIGYVPYIHNVDEFIRVATGLYNIGARVLVCHQTFTGSKFESGIYAPDGIDASLLPAFTHIISGHIHSEQIFGNVIYPGTARWDSVTDANRRKGIWLYEHNSADGRIESSTFISTEKVCSPIQSFEWREDGTDGIPTWPENARVAVELIGTSAWVSKRKAELKGKCSIKTKITDKQVAVTRTAGNSLEHFMMNLFVSSMDRAHLIKTMRDYGIL